jgi:hypothetical protein
MNSFIDKAIIFSSFLFWVAIDKIPLFKNERIINSALIHSIVTAVGATICCSLYPAILYNYASVLSIMPYAVSVTPLIFTGYSAYDLYIGIKSKKPENVLHGFVFLCGCTSAYNNGIVSMLHIFALTETSSIFLNLRPFNKGWIDSMFASTFFVYRLIACPIFTFIYVSNQENRCRENVLLGGTVLTALNVYWFYFIMKKAVKLLKNK